MAKGFKHFNKNKRLNFSSFSLEIRNYIFMQRCLLKLHLGINTIWSKKKNTEWNSIFQILNVKFQVTTPHQWQSGSELKAGWRCQVQSRSRLPTKPFEAFRGFLQNSGKYGLGSLRKTYTGRGPTWDNCPYFYNTTQPKTLRVFWERNFKNVPKKKVNNAKLNT